MKDSERFPVPDHKVVVDTPGWRRIKPRIPDTPQRRRLERQRSIREVVFGIQDGILTTLGIVTGVGEAEGKQWLVVISGVLGLISGALSMGVGEYLGSKAEREVVQAAIETERSEMEAHPQDEFAEQVAYYKLKGFSAEEADMIVRRLAQNPEIYLHEMIRDEFGIDPRIAEQTGLRGPLAMASSFAIGALLPIIPYLTPLNARWTLVASLLLAVAGLFGIGFYAGVLGERNPWRKGMEIVLFGAAVFAISWIAGRYIPPLLGHQPAGLIGAG
ncbi:MAG TPA: VIT1/CCC1 transporter family protein [Candidatus Baltobacteraceae bacterium]